MKEYKPGTTFPGVIGRTVDESEPAWPEPQRSKEGALTYCSLYWTTQDLDNLDAMVALYIHPTLIVWLRMVSLTAICIQLRCAP